MWLVSASYGKDGVREAVTIVNHNQNAVKQL